nr:origin recognition complex protein [Drosophila melanogaster]
MSASNKGGYKTPRKENTMSIENTTNSEEESEDLNTAMVGNAVESQPKVTSRRSTRRPSPTKKYCAYQKESNGKGQEERIVVNYVEMSDERSSDAEDQEEEESIEESENAARPTAKDTHTIQSEYNVAGTSMFGFNTPKKRDAMATAATNATPCTPKTPKTPRLGVKTPDTKRKKSMDQPKTPAHVRTRVKKQIAKMVADSDEDFSGDESDFRPSDEESSSSSSSSDAGNSSDNDAADDEPKTPSRGRRAIVVPVTPKTPSAARTRQSARAKKSIEFVPESDGYFHSHASSKITTSDHTLDRTKNPRTAADRVFSLTSEIKTSAEHEGSINAIMEEYRSYFPKWMCITNEGFNMTTYGLGSKHQTTQSFHREVLHKQTVLVVNGFFPSTTIKDMTDSITSDMLDAGISPANPHEAVDMIEEEFATMPETHLFLIVHNTDGAMTRNVKAQAITSRTARMPNIHTTASIDHMNTPTLWDQGKTCSFNFSWWDCTTMTPYTNETAFENSTTVQNSGELATSSMRSVFSSTTTNSRGIYMTIVKYQLKNKGNATYQGMPFRDTYSSCREAFLVSSDTATRAQTTEFTDHKTVKSKRSVDGSEQTTIPIDGATTQQFTEEQEKK